jgi:anti-repressor protein
MSSREIAELTGKQHKHVLEDTRKMLTGLDLHSADFSAQYTDSTGRSLPCFNLPKDLTITLVSGYNVQMRYAITKRWMELEAQQAPAIPQSFSEALLLASQLQAEKEQLLLQNEAMKPAAAVGNIVGKRKNITIPDFAGRLEGVNKNQIQNTLFDLGYLYKDRDDKWQVRSQYRGKYFGMRYSPTGYSVIVVLERGQQLLAKLYTEGKLVMKVGCVPVITDAAFTSRVLSAINDMLLDTLAAVARKDYEDRRKSQNEGISKAKAQGAFKRRGIDKEKHTRILALLDKGTGIHETAKLPGVSTSTVLRAMDLNGKQ